MLFIVKYLLRYTEVDVTHKAAKKIGVFPMMPSIQFYCMYTTLQRRHMGAMISLIILNTVSST